MDTVRHVGRSRPRVCDRVVDLHVAVVSAQVGQAANEVDLGANGDGGVMVAWGRWGRKGDPVVARRCAEVMHVVFVLAHDVHLGTDHTRRDLLDGSRQRCLLPPLAASGALCLQREAERSAGWESHDVMKDARSRVGARSIDTRVFAGSVSRCDSRDSCAPSCQMPPC
jgi:hypothetical protein